LGLGGVFFLTLAGVSGVSFGAALPPRKVSVSLENKPFAKITSCSLRPLTFKSSKNIVPQND
jgi:hypothetical protein